MDKMELEKRLRRIYEGKKVFLTGHTGFKGAWLSILLRRLGAIVYGYSLEPCTSPNLFELANLGSLVESFIGDVRDGNRVTSLLQEIEPEIIFHLAAQPLVRESYNDPKETFEVNVMGLVNLFEAIRVTPSAQVGLIITSDKCYQNKEWTWGYREDEPMGGYDPYSCSKGCAELITASYRNSFFNPEDISRHNTIIASARAGNVIGGGDWSKDRLIPDFIKSVMKGEDLTIRSPRAIRPWQHVLEPLSGYLLLAGLMYTEGVVYGDAWNFGPLEESAKTVEWMAGKLCELWGENAGFNVSNAAQPHEATYLKLDSSKAKTYLGWRPRWTVEKSLEATVAFAKEYRAGKNLFEVCNQQIEDYFSFTPI